MSGFLPVNLSNVEPASGFDYPPGKYIFEVESHDMRTTQDGQTQRLWLNHKIVMGPGPSTEYVGRKMGSGFNMDEKGARFLKRFVLACGIDDAYLQSVGGQLDPDLLVGRQFVATVTKQGQYTNLGNEQPLAEWDAGQPQVPTPGAPAPNQNLVQPVTPPTTPAVATAPAPAPQVPAPAPAPAPAPQAAVQPAVAPPAQPAIPAPATPQLPAPAAPAALPAQALAPAPAPAPATPGQPAAAPTIPAPAPPPGQVGQGS